MTHIPTSTFTISKRNNPERLTLPEELEGTDPLYDVHRDESKKHQRNRQLAEVVQPTFSVHLCQRVRDHYHNDSCIIHESV